MAYQAFDRDGEPTIFVSRFPDVNAGTWEVSIEGGISPVWDPSGNVLYYRQDDALLAVDITTTPAFAATNHRVLFRGRYVVGNGRTYDITPDGSRFMMLKEESSSSVSFHIALNWFDELNERVPVL